MSTATTIVAPPKIDRLRDGETRIVLRNIDWATFEAISGCLDGQHVRIAYDRGDLELMTKSSCHERYKEYSGRFLGELAVELDDAPSMRPYGETTWKRRGLDRGFEADQCYYLDPAKLAVIAGRDPDRQDDPLPDLLVEIEISESALDKMALYSALGIPEVWRCDGEAAVFEQLGPDGVYRPGERSLFFPVSPEDWIQWLWECDGAELKDWTRRLRAWIHDELRNRPQ